MKKILFIQVLIVFLSAFGVTAQESKVIDRSAKKAPEWLKTEPEGFIVAEVEASDLSSAKDKAIEEIAKRIVMSVATNVSYSSSSSARIETVDGKTAERETFGYDNRIAAANIPFIKGISLTEAQGSYWEQCREKKTDRIFYRYAVLYPFSASQLRDLRTEFEASEREKAATMARLRNELNQVSSSAQIEQAVTELSNLQEYFFDDVRRKEAEGLQKNYKQLYKGLTLKASTPSNGKFSVVPLLNGQPFETGGVPVLKANCASRLQVTPLSDGKGYEVTYDDIDCLDDEDNWIDVSLRIRDAKISQRVFINGSK